MKKEKTELAKLEAKEKELIEVFKKNKKKKDFDFPIDELTELRDEMAHLIWDICSLEREWDYYEWIQEAWGWDDDSGCTNFDVDDVFNQIKEKNFYV